MKKKYLVLFLLAMSMQFSHSQELRLQKGQLIDSIISNDSLKESFALYLPKKFDLKRKWPLIVVFEMGGRAKQALSVFKDAAEKKGFILAAPNSIHDSISLAKNMAISQRAIEKLITLLPIHKGRTYTAGFENGGRFANLVPVFIKEIEGTVSVGAAVANLELLAPKNQFYFIGIVGVNDFNYTTLLEDKKALNKLKFKNTILVYEGVGKYPASGYLEEALDLFNLSAMTKGNLAKDSVLIQKLFQEKLSDIRLLQQEKKLLLAHHAMTETLSAFRTYVDVDSLRTAQRNLKKDKLYRSLKRNESAAFFKESLKREDFNYFLQEDVLTYNYKNLGWWNYQMTQLNGFIFGDSKVEQEMGTRLKAYLNALIEDNIVLLKLEETVDEAALIFLYMLKTITQPDIYDNYLEVISISAKNDDYGTALFYLEEVLKKGFKDTEKLYSIEHTTLFRITPEFNEIVEKYLKGARYEIKDE
ncbi:hypothetical protein MTsPCn5_27180 [Croceitalea sp. MTPC5]|uniref:alpha/beta hydrolase n=1 Tax=Croceitalea sp. MTPC5 TaxID=3056565 RepID=UPI002B36DC16|nr:hypothetical protein MTsPCn5_27180 [Croceitalea sp. MTPC5]